MSKPEKYPAICIIESSGEKYLYPDASNIDELYNYANLMCGIHKIGKIYDMDGGLVAEATFRSRLENIGRARRVTPRQRKKTPDRPVVSKTPNPVPMMPTFKKKGDSDPLKRHGRRAVTQHPNCKPGRSKLPVEGKHRHIYDLLIENAGKPINDKLLGKIGDADLVCDIIDGLVAITVSNWKRDGDKIVNETGRELKSNKIVVENNQLVAGSKINREWLLELKHEIQHKKKKDFNELLRMFNVD